MPELIICRFNPSISLFSGPTGRGRIALCQHRPEDGLFIRAVCATNFENLDNFRAVCGEGRILTTDYREIMADPKINAVFVCTPDYLHAEHAIAALQADKHLFLEKPMAITIADCDAILAAAKAVSTGGRCGNAVQDGCHG